MQLKYVPKQKNKQAKYLVEHTNQSITCSLLVMAVEIVNYSQLQ